MFVSVNCAEKFAFVLIGRCWGDDFKLITGLFLGYFVALPYSAAKSYFHGFTLQ